MAPFSIRSPGNDPDQIESGTQELAHRLPEREIHAKGLDRPPVDGTVD
jgi:hypothetical protein